MSLSATQLEQVAAVFRAFSEPTRLAILQELKSGDRYVNELAERLPTSQANISKQLKALHAAGLIWRRKEGTQVRYGIAEPMVMELCRLVCDKLNRQSRQAAKDIQFP